jgi:hypothetical protein
MLNFVDESIGTLYLLGVNQITHANNYLHGLGPGLYTDHILGCLGFGNLWSFLYKMPPSGFRKILAREIL